MAKVAWALQLQRRRRQMNPHTLSYRRAYLSVCLQKGSDPVQQVGLDFFRHGGCSETARRSAERNTPKQRHATPHLAHGA